MECKVIMANVRQYAGGAYLNAVTKKGHEREARITVEFTGNAYEQTTGILNIYMDTRVRQVYASSPFHLIVKKGSDKMSSFGSRFILFVFGNKIC